MTAEVTPWFNGTVKPARPGVQWLLAATSVKKAAREREASQQQNTIRWRGLAQEPKV